MSTTDRIAVIRGRLTAMDRGEIDWVTVWDHAPADLAWAVGEVDGLSASLRGALRDIAIHATRAERAEREVEHVKAVLAAERVILRQVLEERDGALRDRRDAERERDVQFEMACAASTSEREALERLDASRLREAGLHEAEMALQEGFESAIRERDEARAALAELVRHRHSWKIG